MHAQFVDLLDYEEEEFLHLFLWDADIIDEYVDRVEDTCGSL